MIRYVQGNIFHSRTEAVVNPVNTVGVMGAGLALTFKRAAPENFQIYRKACKRRNFKLGSVLTVRLKNDRPVQYIINFPTKGFWGNPSRLEDIEAGLWALVREVEELEIESVSVPPLGCGLGGLRWSDVEPLIHDILGTAPFVRWFIFTPC